MIASASDELNGSTIFFTLNGSWMDTAGFRSITSSWIADLKSALIREMEVRLIVWPR